MAKTMQIGVRVTEEEHLRIQEMAKMQDKTMTEFCRERVFATWNHKELEDLGFGLVLERLRRKKYDDAYIKRFVGEMLLILESAPEYTQRFGYDKTVERELLGERRFK